MYVYLRRRRPGIGFFKLPKSVRARETSFKTGFVLIGGSFRTNLKLTANRVTTRRDRFSRIAALLLLNKLGEEIECSVVACQILFGMNSGIFLFIYLFIIFLYLFSYFSSTEDVH